MISEARSAAESEAQKVSKEGDSRIGSIHDGGEGSREDAVNAVLDAFRS
jgi:vacuolar-type H+-ATPase subunit H